MGDARSKAGSASFCGLRSSAGATTGDVRFGFGVVDKKPNVKRSGASVGNDVVGTPCEVPTLGASPRSGLNDTPGHGGEAIAVDNAPGDSDMIGSTPCSNSALGSSANKRKVSSDNSSKRSPDGRVPSAHRGYSL
ncbi:unnamed protein product [Ilex paraguariensis]|uniref:Uncharacterized protein n=1 Tax=Ilex paraguariensis TaxID=185542 RepID=A0ABC8QZU2_9AQUA